MPGRVGGKTTVSRPQSLRAKVAVGLLEVFLVAIVAALLLTVTTVSTEGRLISAAAVGPIIVLNVVFIRYCRHGKAWSYAGASVLGAVGVALRLLVSNRPNLEVGGGLPVWLNVAYLSLGAAVSVANYVAFWELRAPKQTAR